MDLKIINKEKVVSFVASAMKQYAVAGPVEQDGRFLFAPLKDAADLRLAYTTTTLPPKKYLLPQEETLFTYETEQKLARTNFNTQQLLLFGVHTCDIHAMGLLDAAFAQGYPDAHYARRRATTYIVGIECLAPCDDQSFCKSMNTLSANSGFDLHLIDLGNKYAVEVGTSAGQALLCEHAQAHAATREDLALLDKTLSAKWGRFPQRLDVERSDLPSLMTMSHHSPLWEELGEKCLGCGACNIVCPTCYCFDVRDYASLDGKTTERRRVWDSCQLDEFALVTTGENFRRTRAQRLRHRFMRKGKYLSERFGPMGCVGCGRCARACLVNITPVGVWNSLHQAHAV